MRLDLALLTPEARSQPETNIHGEARPHEPGGQEPPRSMWTRMRETMKSKEQLRSYSSGNQRTRGTRGIRGHIEEDGRKLGINSYYFLKIYIYNVQIILDIHSYYFLKIYVYIYNLRLTKYLECTFFMACI